MGLITDIILDLNQLGVPFTLGRKEEPTRIYDNIQYATCLFTHVHTNGDLRPGLTSFLDVPLYCKL